jgi:hypothetical protein
MACTRLLVERPAYERVRNRVVDVLRSLRVGDPANEAVDIGPLISAGALDRFSDFVDLAQSSAELLTGGGRVRPGELPGHFVTPAAVSGVDLTSPIVQQDLFGPLLTIEPFDNEEEAIELANATPFGLAPPGEHLSQGPTGRPPTERHRYLPFGVCSFTFGRKYNAIPRRLIDRESDYLPFNQDYCGTSEMLTSPRLPGLADSPRGCSPRKSLPMPSVGASRPASRCRFGHAVRPARR